MGLMGNFSLCIRQHTPKMCMLLQAREGGGGGTPDFK